MNDNIPEEHTEKLAIRNIAYGVVLVITLAFVLVGVGSAWLLFLTEEISVPQYAVSENTSSTASNDAEKVLERVDYVQLAKIENVVSYKETSSPYVDGAGLYHPYQLTAIDNSGKEHLILEGKVRRQFYPCPIGERCRNRDTFCIMSSSTRSNKVFLDVCNPDTDAGSSGLLSYNPHTGILKRLTFYYDHASWWYGPGSGLSPDGTRIISTNAYKEGKGRPLYLLDLDSESVTLLKELPEGETFVRMYGIMAGEPYFQWAWLDEHTVEVSIYDKTQPQGIYETTYPFLRKEIIIIP